MAKFIYFENPHAFRDSTLRFCVVTPEKVNSSKFHFSTLIYITYTSTPLVRTTFRPSPRPPWRAPARPERTGAALSSHETSAAHGTISAARQRGQSEELRPTVICCENDDIISTITYL